MGSTGTTFAKDMVPRQAEVFHGRSQDLLKVKQLSRQSPVLVTGRSGVGKTSFALHFARKNASH
jgi:KaiC/GvpD/RAD55 family RecA-like ATPase